MCINEDLISINAKQERCGKIDKRETGTSWKDVLVGSRAERIVFVSLGSCSEALAAARTQRGESPPLHHPSLKW